MGKSIFDFAKEDVDDREEKKERLQDVDNGKIEMQGNINLKEKIEEYKSLSQEELMQKLIDETNKKKQDGTFDYENIKKMTDSFAPYLDDNQKQMLQSLMSKIK